ncbi:MAG: hypothetical protein ACPGFC_07920, partial [Paracoccaceae bacterium]
LERAANNKNQSLELEILTQAKSLLQEGEDKSLPESNAEVLRLMNRLAMRARHFGKAQRYAQLLFNKTRRDYYAATELLAQAMYHRGKMVDALEHLELVPDARLTRASRKRKSDVAQITVLTRASEAAVPLPAADTFLPRADTGAVLEHLGDHQKPAGHRLIAAAGITRTPSHLPKSDPVTPQPDIDLVFCGGFKWSGASAVRDYLIGFENVASPRADFRIFTENDYCVRTIYEAFMTKNRAGLPEAAKGFALEKLLGLTPCDPKPRRLLKTRSAALLPQANPEEATWIEATGTRFLKAVLSNRKSFPREALQDFIDDCSRVICPPQTKVCVYDSVLRAFDGDLFNLLPKGHLLSVFRDPRDMYATHCLRGGWTAGVEVYAQDLSEMLRAHKAYAHDRIVTVQFERFVLSEAYRKKIRTLVLGKKPTPRAVQDFRAEDSATNIGIHADFQDRDAIAYLEKTFPDLCIDTPAALATSGT